MPRLTCECGAICEMSETMLRERVGQMLRCRRCGRSRRVPGSSLPVMMRPVPLSSTPSSPIPPPAWKPGPIAIMFAALAVVVIVEWGLIHVMQATSEAISPVI